MVRLLRESADNIEAIASKFINSCKRYSHRDPEEVKKRIASVDEFDNGRVLHGDWETMSVADAEYQARAESIENPDAIYYVQYDDPMIASSDVKWQNGKVV